MEKKTKIGVWSAYVYLLLPFALFVVGWLKTWIAIPLIFLLAICFYQIVKHAPSLWRPEFTRSNVEKIVFIIIVIVVWVYISGIGRYVFQNQDHTARNAIFDILVNFDWPIRGDSLGNGMGSETSLIYYIGFWIPAAAVGKVFGIEAGYFAQLVWAVLGIVLFYYLICARTKKIEIWPLFLVIFFSGLDYIGHFLIGTDMTSINSAMHLEWWNDPYQISSMTTQLFWVFNQCIPAWLATLLLVNQKNNRSVVIIWAMTMLSSTLAFVGLLPIMIYVILSRKYETGQKWFQALWRDTVTLENVVGGGIVGIISFLYLSGNFSGGMISTSGKAVKPNGYDGSLLLWILCIVLEVGIYLILLYKNQKHNKLFYLIAAELCLFPLIRVGISSDFSMRAVIPAQVILLLYLMDGLRDAFCKKKNLIIVVYMLVLGIGSITPIHEFARTCSETVNRQRMRVQVEELSEETIKMLKPGNFAGKTNGNFFYTYFAKESEKLKD